MKQFRNLLFITLLSACSPQVISATQTPNPTTIQVPATNEPEVLQSSTVPLPTRTVTSIPSEATESGFELPPDCSDFNPSIDQIYYHDLSHGACNNPTLSPDESQIAYASLATTDAGEIVQELRLFSKPLSQSFPIYRSECGILYSEWTPTDYLVISDFPQDVGCGRTIIYDTEKGEIITTLDGAVHRSWRDYWSSDKNSFFTISPDLFGPVCFETLSGFDFISYQSIPAIKPITPNTNIYVVIGEPVWSADNKSLWAVLRDGICTNPENNECMYSNSYILSIDFSKTAPAMSYPFYDPATDYSFVKSDTGTLEVKSTPAKAVNCQDIWVEESK